MNEEVLTKIISDIQLHIGILNDEYGELASTVAVLGNDVAWLKKFFFIIAIATIGTSVTALWNVILHKKNGKK